MTLTGRAGQSTPKAMLLVGLGTLWVLALARITLTPGAPTAGGGAQDTVFQLCVFCGTRGTGDAVLNMVLFLPLGLLLGTRWKPWVVLGAGLLLSSLIEIRQLSIDGRYSNLGDILSNGLGAGLGGVMAHQLQEWLAKGAPNRAAAGIAVALPVSYVLLAGLALTPTSTDARYYGQWTPDLTFMPQYEGQLLVAELDGATIPRGEAYPLGSEVRSSLANDWKLETRVVIGPPPVSVSPVVSIYDEEGQEILLLGIHGADLVLRERTVGDALRLDRFERRWWNALEDITEGDTVTLGAHRRGADRCLTLGEDVRCGLRGTPGNTWALLLFLEGAGRTERLVLSMAWMATLWMLVGLVGGSGRQVGVATAAGAALLLGVVLVTRLAVPPPLEWLGMLLGVSLGRALRPVAHFLLGVRASTQ